MGKKRKKSEKSQTKRERARARRRKREAASKELAGQIAKGFAKWCGDHMPAGTKWVDAAAGMPAVMADYLFETFPSMGRELLDELADEHVHATEKRLRVDTPAIATAIIAAGGGIN